MSTPARKQYLQIKSQYPDAILFYQVGDFYETFDEDARTAAGELQIVLTSRSYGDDRVPLAGVPLHALDNYLGKLIARGYKIAICEQVGEVGRGIVDRAVTRILTAGTLSEPNLLPSRQNNYLAAIAVGRSRTALATIDVSTGEFSVTWFESAELPASLEGELQRLAPAECLLLEGKETSPNFQLPAQTMTVTPCPAYFFEREAAQERLCRLFGVKSLTAYGCADIPQAISAAGAIVAYLEKMNVNLLSLLTGLRSYRTSNYMMLDAHTQRNLDLLQGSRSGTTAGSLLGVLDRTITPMGARQIRQTITQPLLDLVELEGRLTAVNELYESPALRSRFTMTLQKLGDLERIAGRIRQGSAVRREVLALSDYLEVVPQLEMLLRGCEPDLLRTLADTLDSCPEMGELIRTALVHPDRDQDQDDDKRLIRQGYSPELDELIASIRDSRRWIVSLEARERVRTGIKSLKVGFNKVFGYYIEISHANARLAPDDYQRKQTLTNAERYITPELKEHEARILSAEERIEALERSIFAEILRQLSHSYTRLIETARAIARLDVLLSLAEVAVHQGYVRPQLEQGRTLEIVGGRHPVVEYALEGDVFIPNDTVLEAENGARILLLTGPNMAGKSTYLRQVALISLMAQLGSFVPARSVQIGLVDQIFTRVGAEDDIASGKSTFMVEMEETATILHHATSNSLIILDEIGRGTSTYDGLAIARAVVEHLHEKTGARTLFATHYHELSTMANELEHLRTCTMAISEGDSQGIIFLHQVVPGSIGRSYGVHVARLAGMPQDIVQRANAVLKQLEAGLAVTSPTTNISYSQMKVDRRDRSNGLSVAEGKVNGKDAYAMPANYRWQSVEARGIAEALERSEDGFDPLDGVDVYAITPLDALHLLLLRQKKQSRLMK
jgi:DNA mismatch repair protein MutS